MVAADNAGAQAAGGYGRFAAHPLRDFVLGEMHARPFQTLAAPRVVVHLAFMSDAPAAEAAAGRLAEMCRRLGVEPPQPGARHHVMPIGDGRLRFESHSEFTTFSWDAPWPGIDRPPPPGPFDEDFVPPGPLLVATRLDLLAATEDLEPHLGLFDPLSLAVSSLIGGRAITASDFRPDADGMTRILVLDRGLGAHQAGPAVQRLIEIETYRTLALLGLPEAQRIAPEIQRIEAALATITARIDDSAGLEANRTLLHDLTSLAGDLEAATSAGVYRFGASRAYAEIVHSRLRSIDEAPVADHGSWSAFLDRRMAPAMRTCQTTWDRQSDLATRIARAAELLRTRVEIEVEQQNRALLRSMNRRGSMQLRLQQTVEGLSVAAVSYYIVGLIRALAEGSGFFGVEIDPNWIAAAAVVPVVLVVAWLVRRIRSQHADPRESDKG